MTRAAQAASAAAERGRVSIGRTLERTHRTEPGRFLHGVVQDAPPARRLADPAPRAPPRSHRADPASRRRNRPEIGPRGGLWWEIVCKLGCFVEESGVQVHQRAGVEGLLPPLHPGSSFFTAHGLPRHLRLLPRREEPAHRPGEVPGRAERRGRAREGHRAAASRSGARATTRSSPPRRSQGMHPSFAGRAPDPRVLRGQLARHRARLAPAASASRPFLVEHAGLGKEVVVVGADDCLQVWDRKAWADYNAASRTDISDITAQLGQPS